MRLERKKKKYNEEEGVVHGPAESLGNCGSNDFSKWGGSRIHQLPKMRMSLAKSHPSSLFCIAIPVFKAGTHLSTPLLRVWEITYTYTT